MRNKMNRENKIHKCVPRNSQINLSAKSLSKWVNPYKACIYWLCRDFFDGDGYDLGTKTIYFFLEPFSVNTS